MVQNILSKYTSVFDSSLESTKRYGFPNLSPPSLTQLAAQLYPLMGSSIVPAGQV